MEKKLFDTAIRKYTKRKSNLQRDKMEEGLGCIATILKYLLFGSNLLIFIVGCIILGTGIFALFDSSSLITLVDESGISGDVSAYRFFSAGYILIAIAVFVCILAFFGCCGAIKENKCMLSTYFVLILLMFIMVIVGVIMGLTASLTALEGTLEKTMKNFKDDPSNINISGKDKIVTDAWNQIQKKVSSVVEQILPELERRATVGKSGIPKFIIHPPNSKYQSLVAHTLKRIRSTIAEKIPQVSQKGKSQDAS